LEIPSDYAKRTMLQAAIANIPSLNNIKNKCNISHAQGLPYPNFDAYSVIVKAAAQIHDEETVLKQKIASRNVQVNMHDLQDHKFYDDHERTA
jgi:hypothetical protein